MTAPAGPPLLTAPVKPAQPAGQPPQCQSGDAGPGGFGALLESVKQEPPRAETPLSGGKLEPEAGLAENGPATAADGDPASPLPVLTAAQPAAPPIHPAYAASAHPNPFVPVARLDSSEAVAARPPTGAETQPSAPTASAAVAAPAPVPANPAAPPMPAVLSGVAAARGPEPGRSADSADVGLSAIPAGLPPAGAGPAALTQPYLQPSAAAPAAAPPAACPGTATGTIVVPPSVAVPTAVPPMQVQPAAAQLGPEQRVAGHTLEARTAHTKPAVARSVTWKPDTAEPISGPLAPLRATPGPQLLPQLTRPLFTLAAAPNGRHTMTVQVTPESLGPLTVRAYIDAAGIRIELFAASDAGREAVRTVLPELRRELSDSGLGATLELSDRSGPADSRPGDSGRNGQAHSGQPHAGHSGGGPGNRGGGTGALPNSRRKPVPETAGTGPPDLSGGRSTLDILA